MTNEDCIHEFKYLRLESGMKAGRFNDGHREIMVMCVKCDSYLWFAQVEAQGRPLPSEYVSHAAVDRSESRALQ